MKPRTSPRTKKRRAALIGSPEAAYTGKLERFQLRLLRKVQAWARKWETCPLAGCGRNRRCLKPDSCRVVPEELTEEMRLQVRAALFPERVARDAEASAWARRIRESFDESAGDADPGE